jgi:hypothetical protein
LVGLNVDTLELGEGLELVDTPELGLELEPELELERELLLVSIGDTPGISLLLELIDVMLEEEAGIGVVAEEPTNRPLSGPFRETLVPTIGENRFQPTTLIQEREL